MRTPALVIFAVLTAATAWAQHAPLDRLSRGQLDVMPPSQRVSGVPGQMTVRQTSCRTLPDVNLRRRIVDIAVQEWAFFGFTVVDQAQPFTPNPRPRGARRGFRWLNPDESARVASSIAGYWTVTASGGWILGNQNEAWKGPDGIASRWRDPWSAAFVSWVMCEAGLGDAGRFARAVAHHVYIDQAIRARGNSTDEAAYVAYDVGEVSIEPGDLLCSARRPGYQTIADRQRQMGDGARTHCDVVVGIDRSASRLLAIGGNVRGAVSLKLLPVTPPAAGAGTSSASPVGEPRGMFVHLKLRAAAIEADALRTSPTIEALGCAVGFTAPAQLVATNLTPAALRSNRC